MTRSTLNFFAAAGLAGTAASLALADPAVINITGATLLQNFVKSSASTRDFIDVDHDGITLTGTYPDGFRQQLAPDISSPSGTYPVGAVWLVHYRAVGSVNGLKELIRNGRTYFTGSATDPAGFPLAAISASDGAYYNRTLFTAGGVAAGAGGTFMNSANPGGFPWRSTTPVSGSAPTPVFPGAAPQGLRADLVPLDVPSLWATIVAGPSTAWNLRPGQPGYGNNPALCRNKDGTIIPLGDPAATPGTYNQRLASLGDLTLYDGVPSNADGNTIFDTSLAYAPTAPITNVGTGLTQIKMSELQHLFTTGRLPTGENLTAVTRDSGSGTRNSFMNSLRVDPSFGVGENIGAESTATAELNPGSSYSPSNKGGSGAMETTVRYTRLGVGYTGAERTPALMGVNNRAEILSVMNDILGGTLYVRPTAANVISNSSVNTWRMSGPAQMVSLGDPGAEPVADGGDANPTPHLRNPAAAAYINNIRKSVIAFSATSGSITNAFSPGEAAATFFILPNGVEYTFDTKDVNGNGETRDFIPNPNLVPALRDWELQYSTYALAANAPLYAAFDTTKTGQAPVRTTGVTYSDGIGGGGSYRTQAGGPAVAFNSTLTARNKVCGDFNADGVRNIDDTTEMIKAFRDRAGLGTWTSPDGIYGAGNGNLAVVEILGDFNNDGSFTAADVRYFADGLAIATSGPNTGKLDRKAGFAAVDNASQAAGGSLNFFGTTKATGVSYSAGDSRADVAGPTGRVTPGYAPIGADGTINGYDITYIYKQFNQNPRVTDGALNWDTISEAIGGDLSCDITGDRIVDQNDVLELVTGILGTTMGDVNLDGQQNAADAAIVNAHLNLLNANWQDGDVNGDGVVNNLDLAIVNGQVQCGPADIGSQGGLPGPDNHLDNNDFVVFIDFFFTQNPAADVGVQGGLPGHDTLWDNNDFVVFIGEFFAGCGT